MGIQKNITGLNGKGDNQEKNSVKAPHSEKVRHILDTMPASLLFWNTIVITIISVALALILIYLSSD